MYYVLFIIIQLYNKYTMFQHTMSGGSVLAENYHVSRKEYCKSRKITVPIYNNDAFIIKMAARVISLRHALPYARDTMDRTASFPAEACQPRDFTFPKKVFAKSSQRMYSFQAKWFDLWRWLHWDDGKKSVFCHTCVRASQAGKLTFSKNAEAAFITRGFQNWKDATRDSAQRTKWRRHSVMNN